MLMSWVLFTYDQVALTFTQTVIFAVYSVSQHFHLVASLKERGGADPCGFRVWRMTIKWFRMTDEDRFHHTLPNHIAYLPYIVKIIHWLKLWFGVAHGSDVVRNMLFKRRKPSERQDKVFYKDVSSLIATNMCGQDESASFGLILLKKDKRIQTPCPKLESFEKWTTLAFGLRRSKGSRWLMWLMYFEGLLSQRFLCFISLAQIESGSPLLMNINQTGSDSAWIRWAAFPLLYAVYGRETLSVIPSMRLWIQTSSLFCSQEPFKQRECSLHIVFLSLLSSDSLKAAWTWYLADKRKIQK